MARKSKAIPIIDPRTGVTPGLSTTPAVPVLPLLHKSFEGNAAASNAKTRPHFTEEFSAGTSRPLTAATVMIEGGSCRSGHTGKANALRSKRPRCTKRSGVDTAEARPRPQSPICAQGVKVDEATPFDIYARPFVPKDFTVINTLPGRSISTPMGKGTNYDEYIAASLGPATSLLPVPPAIGQSTTAQYNVSLDPRQYEAFFQHHLRPEAEAEGSEVEACSLYGHDVLIKQAFDPLATG